MQQRALLLEAHHTTHIEGAHLTLDQSVNLIADYLGSGDPVTESLIREIHKRLVRGVRGNATAPGEYRRIHNYVGNSIPKEIITLRLRSRRFRR